VVVGDANVPLLPQSRGAFPIPSSLQSLGDEKNLWLASRFWLSPRSGQVETRPRVFGRIEGNAARRARSGAGTPSRPQHLSCSRSLPREGHSQTPRRYRRSEMRKLVATAGQG